MELGLFMPRLPGIGRPWWRSGGAWVERSPWSEVELGAAPRLDVILVDCK